MNRENAQIAPAMAAPLPAFFPFMPEAGNAAASLDQLHSLLADRRIAYNWCRHCFDLEHEQRMRAVRDSRTAPAEAFFPIYFENPNCSGGEDTFLHWLPRGLELGFLDPDIDPDLIEQAVRLGLWHWPAEVQDALRTLLSRVAADWFLHGTTAPLLLPQTAKRLQHSGDFISRRLVRALLYLRVEPAHIFDWLAQQDSPTAWSCLMDLLPRESFLPGPPYYALPEADSEAAMAAGVSAVGRIARAALFTAVSDTAMARAWVALQDSEPQLAQRLADMEWLRPTYAFALEPAERNGDRALVHAASRCCP
ncbi:hypothetical protein ACLBXM_19730 [Xanthobacteraceae bacterium A53D]